jgi:hypothetical protein
MSLTLTLRFFVFFADSFKPGTVVTPEQASELTQSALTSLTSFHELESKSDMMPSLIEEKFVIKIAGTVAFVCMHAWCLLSQ